MRTLYFALPAILTPHLKELTGKLRLPLQTSHERVMPNFNEDILSVEVDETVATVYSTPEEHQKLAEMRKHRQYPEGLWTENDGYSYWYDGDPELIAKAELVVPASSRNLETVPHIRVILTHSAELRTDPWWWNDEAVKILLKEFAPEWANMMYTGVKVNDKSFEAFYIPMVIKPKELETAIEDIFTTASSALEKMSKVFHSFERDNEIDFFSNL